ncbi:hypothetical protein GCM10011575_02100 [Microlunatus endophyticus]|uniref:Uncharacterized protein n=1 Tax=Microlunatus endophyticus TaxID=1716077 RepID=A0A917S049_9ACTN|nr:hypothetical protein [Microlunatus endophyticus]GGL47782.1 hypothetical protein GCM10011575_02100 [Microlunatus endophyticus]
MPNVSVIGYTAARSVLPAWTPVWVVFFLVIAIGYASGSHAAASLEFGAAILVPISAWMAVATFRGEDPIQAATHGLHHGNPTGYRFLVSASAFLASLAVLPISLLLALLRAPRYPHISPLFLIMALLAQVAGAAIGTAIGTWLTRPIIERASTGFIVGGVVGISLIAIPNMPPIRLLTDVIIRAPASGTIAAPSGVRVIEAVLITLGSLIIAAAACWLAGAFARRRI